MSRLAPRSTPPSLRSRALLFNRLAAMERTGLPAIQAFEGLDVPAAQTQALRDTCQRLRTGQPLDQAGLRGGLFSPLEAQLIAAAVAAGSPLACYQRVARQHEQAAMRQTQLASRLWLPGLTLAAALFIRPAPALASGQLSLWGYGAVSLGPLLLLWWLGRAVWRWQRGRDWRRPARLTRFSPDHWLHHLPLWGRHLLRVQLRNLVRSLADLLAAGLPLFQALPLALATVHTPALRTALATVLPTLERGAPLSQALSSALLPTLSRRSLPQAAGLVAVVRVGEASGQLPQLLTQWAEDESREIDAFEQGLADVLPKLAYGAVMVWMVGGLLGG